MVKYENECVGCPAELGCLGSACPNRNVPHFYCDECEEDVEELFKWDDKQLCIDCIKKKLEKIEPE
jgi:hypothetical protein